jgi:hypothetical protein
MIPAPKGPRNRPKPPPQKEPNKGVFFFFFYIRRTQRKVETARAEKSSSQSAHTRRCMHKGMNHIILEKLHTNTSYIYNITSDLSIGNLNTPSQPPWGSTSPRGSRIPEFPESPSPSPAFAIASSFWGRSVPQSDWRQSSATNWGGRLCLWNHTGRWCHGLPWLWHRATSKGRGDSESWWWWWWFWKFWNARPSWWSWASRWLTRCV